MKRGETMTVIEERAQADTDPGLPEALFDRLSEGVLACDPAGRVTAVNRAALDILGLSGDQLIGQALGTLPLRCRRADGSLLLVDEYPLVAALRSGEAGPDVEVEVLRFDRAPIWLRVRCHLLDAAVGRIVAVATFTDITAQKSAEQALRSTEVRNRSLAEAIVQSGGSVVITDREGRIEYANPACCRAYGYAESELIGANPRIFKSGETPDAVYEELWETICAGQTWRGELSNRTRDGHIVREAVSVSPVRDDRGEIRHFVAIKEDITQLREDERKRHELFERVARLERMEVVGALAAGVAHDFNNVLVAILGYSELAANLLRGEGGSPRVARYIEEIRIGGDRARTLVQQLLSLSRSGTPSQAAATRLDVVVREAAGLLQATLPQTVAFVTWVEPDLPTLSVDPGHIHQVLMNLLMNARDAIDGRKRGVIQLMVRRIALDVADVCASCRREHSGDYIALTVSDDGCGIRADVLERIFEPFFTTKDVGHGTGMGLAVVHGMAHLYDGHVRVVSALGAGTTVEVFLPATLLEAPAATAR